MALSKRKLSKSAHSLATNKEALRSLSRLFPNAVILTSRMQIVYISQTLEQQLGYEHGELSSKHLGNVCDLNESDRLKILLKQNFYFENEFCAFFAKDARRNLVEVSGFRLEHIFGLSGIIVLKCFQWSERPSSFPDETRLQIDQFVYQTAHSLRGPLATLMGLIHLAQRENNDTPLEFLLSKMNAFATILNERLCSLTLYSEADKTIEQPWELVKFSDVARRIENFIESHDAVKYRLAYNNSQSFVKKANYVLALLKNLILFTSKITETRSCISISLNASHGVLEIVVKIPNLVLSQEEIVQITCSQVSYSDVLCWPKFQNCFAARKITTALGGETNFLFDMNHTMIIQSVMKNIIVEG